MHCCISSEFATLGLNLLFSRIFGPAGIAVAYLIVASLMALVLIVWFQNFLHTRFRIRKWRGWKGRPCFRHVFIGLNHYRNLLPHPAQEFLPGILRLFLSGLLGVTVYASALYLAGLPEIRLLVKRIGKKSSRSEMGKSGLRIMDSRPLWPADRTRKEKERAVRMTERGNILGVRVTPSICRRQYSRLVLGSTGWNHIIRCNAADSTSW